MPPIEDLDDNEIDRDTGTDVSEDEDSLRNIISRALADQTAAGGGDEDEPSLEDAPPTPENPMVSVEDGLDLIEKAGKPEKPAAPTEAGKAPEQPAEAQPEKTPEEKAAEEAAAAEAGKAKDEGEPAKPAAEAPAADDLDGLLDGIDADRAQKIRDRISAGGALSTLLTERKDQLAAIAETPEKALGNLLHLHDYANKNPDQYLAWAAWQLGGDNAVETLTKAAEHLGLKVVKPEEEDPFEDERAQKLREENEALKRQVNGGRPFAFGPDVQPADPLAAFKAEKGADGKPLRPFWDDLAPLIGQQALALRQTTGKPVTTADLARLYDEAATQMAQRFGAPAPAAAPQTTVAAPAAPVVAKDSGKKPAAPALERAKAASKHLDGEGQGADRHTAPPTDGSLADLIRFNLAKATGQG